MTVWRVIILLAGMAFCQASWAFYCRYPGGRAVVNGTASGALLPDGQGNHFGGGKCHGDVYAEL